LQRSYRSDRPFRFEGSNRDSLRPLLIILREHQSITEDKMKLVRFDDWKTGLLVQLPIGLRVIDVVESLGALSFAAPISGVLNGILKDRGSWGPLIDHWGQASVGLRGLALLAAVGPGNSRLVIRRLDEIHFGSSSANSNDIAALEIAEAYEAAHNPTWREAMRRQPALPQRADESIDGRVVSLDAHRKWRTRHDSNV
jgi:hypothetical protein